MTEKTKLTKTGINAIITFSMDNLIGIVYFIASGTMKQSGLAVYRVPYHWFISWQYFINQKLSELLNQRGKYRKVQKNGIKQ